MSITNIGVGAKIRVINAPVGIRQWAKRELEFPNPEYEKKLRMNKWVGNTPKKVVLYETDGNDVILPYGCWENLSYQLRTNKVAHQILGNDPNEKEVWQRRRINIPLFEYQEKAVQEMFYAGNGILQAPAGSGKTQCGIALAEAWERKTLWITHTQDLLKQSYDRAKQYIHEGALGTITEGKVNVGAFITFATVQTLSNLDLVQYRDVWDVIIVDECHRVSGSPTSVTMFGKVLGMLAATHKYGLSATLHRSDGMIRATYALLGAIRHIVPDTAVESRIVRPKVIPVDTEYYPGQKSLNYDGTLNYSGMISDMCEDMARTALISTLIACDPGESALVLSSRVEHLREILGLLPEWLKEKSAVIDGKMTSKTEKRLRNQYIEDMRTGEKRILFATYQLAKEGLDIPRLDRLFLVTPQKDEAVIIQSVGRVSRMCEGKQTPIVYDIVDRNGYCVKAYRKRCGIYRRLGCEIE